MIFFSYQRVRFRRMFIFLCAVAKLHWQRCYPSVTPLLYTTASVRWSIPSHRGSSTLPDSQSDNNSIILAPRVHQPLTAITVPISLPRGGRERAPREICFAFHPPHILRDPLIESLYTCLHSSWYALSLSCILYFIYKQHLFCMILSDRVQLNILVQANFIKLPILIINFNNFFEKKKTNSQLYIFFSVESYANFHCVFFLYTSLHCQGFFRAAHFQEQCTV